MTISDDEDEILVQFLESEVLSEVSDQEDGKMVQKGESDKREAKRYRVESDHGEGKSIVMQSFLSSIDFQAPSTLKGKVVLDSCEGVSSRAVIFCNIPPELFHHILKFLSSEILEHVHWSVDSSIMLLLMNPCGVAWGAVGFRPRLEHVYHLLKVNIFEGLVRFEPAIVGVAQHICVILKHWHSEVNNLVECGGYCMRWGLLPPTKKLRDCAWKKLYIQRDEEDMVEFVRNCPSEFKEYYIQMQVAKRSQAPLPSQKDEGCYAKACFIMKFEFYLLKLWISHALKNEISCLLLTTVADQVSIWKRSRGLTDKVVSDHACSGETCSYHQIGDAFVCEKTGHVHVCDDTCREVVLDPTNELLVCTISGHCFDRLLSPAEMEPDEQPQGGVTDETEPFMGSGRFARAYLLGYNCADEKELEAVMRFCWY
ncbi:unnamed protein product [Ilex paraguariensis]|uniref:Uncharacterized protein n=1 Tax=Ilex paraguariensis TaxID=185542 RepID=A0ABC8R2Z1_9AQUA